ncbi:MAG: hypothetical protein US63_C0024G0004 [Candidatus Moranbacteria bacterium GW2011_GWC2_37_8]|nr:MAG: hypothetical protein US63_C0024G0004 [Candidatus Moranbacteria bacterium GW2011_GWC2_37_8]KKQ61482.1 MAG: hypothetical protein US82_C0021G0004 [Parcubacteria group bacterium GW2011_GWC1_38_22]KKQ80929.1 MAG: hypothetical protein UT03_C0016G0006 [Candidatus Moranbacteria bacterium GW2011_GWD2_38_7]
MTETNSSPFSTGTSTGNMPAAPAPSQNDFSIRTMHDDLMAMQGKGHIEEKSPVAEIPTQPAAPQPKPFNPQDVSSQKVSQVSSFPEHTSQPAAPFNDTIEITPQESKGNSKNKPASIKIVMSIIILLIIIILGLGAYYLLLIKKPQQEEAIVTPISIETPVTAPIQEPIKEEIPIAIVPPVEKYTKDQLNYLPLDISTIGAQEIKAALVNVANDLKGISMESPYEFIIVDNNKIPVSFPIFATAAKLNLQPSLLTSLGSDFSIYFYNDNSNIRIAVKAQISNKALLQKELVKQEKTFLADASFLFLDNVPEKKEGVFATSNYGEYVVRFLNANAAKDLSIDYTTTATHLLIGTSKNTLRAVIDKLKKESPTKPVGITKESEKTAPQSTTTTVTENKAGSITSTTDKVNELIPQSNITTK